MKKLDTRAWIGLFILARLMLYMALPLDALHGYGDFVTFFSVAQIPGWPFLDYWVEFPPVFPFLSEILFRLSGGQQHVYTYLLILILLGADAGNLYFFQRLASRFWQEDELFHRMVVYLVVLIALPYAWWYFDSLAVLCLLAGLTYVVENKDVRAGIVWGVGALIKFLPLLGLAALWRHRNNGRLLRIAIISIAIMVAGFANLWVVSPEFTRASISSQASKGSWETIWALIDGNLSTGNFGPLVERLDPALASRPVGNPPTVPGWATLPVFLLAGVAILLRAKTPLHNPVAAVGLAASLFFLWSPGWSVQWVLFLLPSILISLDWRNAMLLSTTLILVNLLEWPVLLSRGFFNLLPVSILVRTLLFLLAAYFFTKELWIENRSAQDAEALSRL